MPWARERCWNCDGSGMDNIWGDPDDVRECDVCEGSGQVVARDKRGRFIRNVTINTAETSEASALET